MSHADPIPKCRVPAPIREEIDRQLGEGHRPSDIAAKFGVPTRYAIERSKNLKDKARRHEKRAERIEKITVSPEVGAALESWLAERAIQIG